MSTRHIKVSPKKFIKVWVSDKTAERASRELGISVAMFYNYAKVLRDNGVALPARKTVRGEQHYKLDATDLNDFLSDLQEA